MQKDEQKNSEELQKSLQEQLDNQRDVHQQQVSRLRDEIDEKLRMIEGLSE